MLRAEFTLAAARAINRILKDYPKASSRLAQHAGKRCRFEVPPLVCELRVTSAGLAEPVGVGASGDPDVAFVISAAEVPGFLRDRTTAMQRARFTGDGELAHLISELARELRWDVEEDLSHLVGDVAAHRAAAAGQQFSAWQRDARSRLLDNAAEYLTEERHAFVTKDAFETLVRHVEDLRDATARLEARLQHLTEQQP